MLLVVKIPVAVVVATMAAVAQLVPIVEQVVVAVVHHGQEHFLVLYFNQVFKLEMVKLSFLGQQ
jgi:hypothetical protein